MLHNVNKTLGAMADLILNINQSLKWPHPNNTDDQLDPKQQKYSSKDEMSASDGSNDDGDDSDAELQALCGTEADKTSKDKPHARLEQSNGGNDPLLSEITEDLLNAQADHPMCSWLVVVCRNEENQHLAYRCCHSMPSADWQI